MNKKVDKTQLYNRDRVKNETVTKLRELLVTYRKPHVGFRLVPKSIILNDLESA